MPISTANLQQREALSARRESPGRAIHLLAIIEGDKVSGPAKNLLEFYRTAAAMRSGPAIKLTLAMFERLGKGSTRSPGAGTELAEAARRSGVASFTIAERFAFDIRALSGLKKLIAELQPDLIQTHAVKSHFLVRLLKAGKKTPWVAFHHGYTQTDLRSPMYKQLDRWSLRAPDHIVTVSDASRQQLAARTICSSNITVLHNAIRLLNIPRGEAGFGMRERRVRLGLAPDERVILCVGRLSHEKAPADLVAAVAHLRTLHPNLRVRVVFLGEGPERGNIERTARSAGLSDRITLAGYCEVQPYYEVADLVAIPSISEASPNALLEAMAAGLPVAATCAGGIPEIVSHEETALLVELRDPAAMANAINRLLSDPELCAGLVNRSRKLIQTRFSPETRAQVLVDLYMRVLSQRLADLRPIVRGNAEAENEQLIS